MKLEKKVLTSQVYEAPRAESFVAMNQGVLCGSTSSIESNISRLDVGTSF